MMKNIVSVQKNDFVGRFSKISGIKNNLICDEKPSKKFVQFKKNILSVVFSQKLGDQKCLFRHIQK